jgi:hypothetical protein
VTGRAIVDRKTIHVHDLDESMREFPESSAASHQARLATPLMREGMALGVIGIRRIDLRPFTESQIKLLETFANQAVIAIENVRLFQELKEALEQQTATSEILGVIASSPTEIQPVLDVVAATAARLCEATDAQIRLLEGEGTKLVASFGTVPAPEFTPPNLKTPSNLTVQLLSVRRCTFMTCVQQKASFQTARNSRNALAQEPTLAYRCSVKELLSAASISGEPKFVRSLKNKLLS